MKILYGISPNIGSTYQYLRFKQSCPFTTKVAGYYTHTQDLPHLNYILDSIGFIHKSQENFKKQFFQHVKEFQPDLVISDLEPYTAEAAIQLNIPLWYCSSLFLYPALGYFIRNDDYHHAIYTALHNVELRIQQADKKLIYSPFGSLDFFQLDKKYQWVEPETKTATGDSDIFLSTRPELNDYAKYFNYKVASKEPYSDLGIGKKICTSGESVFLADAIHNQASQIVVCPTISNAHSDLNALFVKNLGIGMDLGQIDLTRKEYAHFRLERALNENNSLHQFKIKKNLTLIELIKKEFNL